MSVNSGSPRNVPSVLQERTLPMFCLRLLSPVLVIVLLWPLAVSASPQVTERAKQFVNDHTAKLQPLEIAANLAWWNANVSGKDEDFQKKIEAQNRIDEALADAKMFAAVKELKQNVKQIDDPVTARAVEVLYLAYLEKQVDPALLKKMVAKSNAVEQAFNVYRAKVDGKELTDSEVRNVLKTSRDSERLRAVWEASKGVGAVVEADLKELVKLRNQAATHLDFPNFHALQLYLNEQNEDDLLKLFDELDDLTREPFRAAKADVDARLAKDYRLMPDELRPWHYRDPFFQETPPVFDVDLDSPFAKADLIK